MPDQAPGDNPLNPFVGSLWESRDLILTRIRSVADALTDLAKIWAIISVVVSTIFIGSYLGQFDMPFLPVDNILPVVIQLFACVFAFLYTVMIVYCFFPLSIKYMISANVQSALPVLFPRPGVETRSVKSSSFWKEYASFYLPSIAFNVLMFILLIRPAIKLNTEIANIVAILFMLLGGALVWRSASENSVATHNRYDVLFWYLVSSIPTVAWYIIVIQSLSGIATRTIGSKLSNFEAFIIGFLVLIVAITVHVICSMARDDKAKRLLIVLSTIGALMFCHTLGVASVGGLILRFTKLGGNSPITYEIRSGPELKGCLVWLSSNYFVIADRREGSCPRLLHTYFSGSQVRKLPTHMLRREDIQVLDERMGS